jgi:hypothetical protein
MFLTQIKLFFHTQTFQPLMNDYPQTIYTFLNELLDNFGDLIYVFLG